MDTVADIRPPFDEKKRDLPVPDQPLRKILANAATVARAGGLSYVGLEHLIASFQSEPSGTAMVPSLVFTPATKRLLSHASLAAEEGVVTVANLRAALDDREARGRC